MAKQDAGKICHLIFSLIVQSIRYKIKSSFSLPSVSFPPLPSIWPQYDTKIPYFYSALSPQFFVTSEIFRNADLSILRLW